MSRTTITFHVHGHTDPRCNRHTGARVPAWIRALLGLNCDACRQARPNVDTPKGEI